MKALMVLAVLALSGCTAAQEQQVVSALKLACMVDGQVVPVAQSVLAKLPNEGAQTAAQIDAELVHPAVVAACASLGGVPAVVSVPTT